MQLWESLFGKASIHNNTICTIYRNAAEALNLYIIHCYTCTLSTVKPVHYPLLNLYIIHCYTCTLSTVTPVHFPLLNLYIIHCFQASLLLLLYTKLNTVQTFSYFVHNTDYTSLEAKKWTSLYMNKIISFFVC